jgi:site-specific DNA-methyltransferase (adenine-specific)
MGVYSMQIENGTFLLTDAIQHMLDMPDECIDMVFTDPPYRTISGGTKSSHVSGFSKSVLAANDGKIFQHNNVSVLDYMTQFYRLLKPCTHCYVMTNNLNLRELLSVAESVGFGFHNLLAWRKNTCNANRWYMKEMELVCFFYKKPAKRIVNAGSKQIFEAPNPRDKRHPTEKPVELMQHYIENSSAVGDLVFDPFAGSGSTAIAAQSAGRRWLSIELDPVFYYSAAARILEYCNE